MIDRHPFCVAVSFRSKVKFLLFLMAFCIVPSASLGSDFIGFYPIAYARTQSPPDLKTLSVICREKKFLGPHITFVGNADKKVLLVVFSEKRVSNLEEVITLEPKFFEPKSGGALYAPTARVGPDATLDWAYVYDRNGDGRVDYFAYLFAVLPLKPDDFPTDFPKGEKFVVKNKEQVGLLYKNTRMIFQHHADDNYDGVSDAVIASIRDPDRNIWVEQFGVLRSTKFDGHVDETWTFKKFITQRIGTVGQSDEHYILQNGAGIKLLSGEEWFDFGTKTFGIINDHARKCGLTKESFLQK